MTSEHTAAEFPATHCAVCDREVLCYLDLDEAEQALARCLECSTPAAEVRWLDLHELETIGYGFVLPPGGCGRPDCGQGQCGRAAPDDAT